MNKSIFKQLALAGTLMVNNMQGEICSICQEFYGDTNNKEVKGWCGHCCKNCKRPNQAPLAFGYCNECNEDWQNHKNKWGITIDFMMIIGKYFENSEDFINVMKVGKKYQQLVLMYKFNPISDTSLFENIQTQHFYKEDDKNNKKEGMYQYIYWFNINYNAAYNKGDNEIKNKKDNEIYKNAVLIGPGLDVKFDNLIGRDVVKEYPLEIENGNCVVPEGITKIGDNCFDGCFQITNIILPSTLKEIGREAFVLTNITYIIIPEGITRIRIETFKNCTSLTNIILPSTLKNIEAVAFADTNIITIIIPEGVTRIGFGCFKNCSQLTNITLPTSLKEINSMAFKNTKITSILIPINVTKMDSICFEGCDQLEEIICPTRLKATIAVNFPSDKITSITIPDGNTK